MREIVVDGSALTVEDVVAVAYGQARPYLGPDVPRRMETSRSVVVKALGGDAPVYGVNTGFGALADTPVGAADLATLQGSIVRSHAAAVGVPLADEVVRALLLLRARTLAAGYSGVRADYPPGCSSCFPSACCRSSPARARWVPLVTWRSSRTWRCR
jgi:histidine ammonia-lyase